MYNKLDRKIRTKGSPVYEKSSDDKQFKMAAVKLAGTSASSVSEVANELESAIAACVAG